MNSEEIKETNSNTEQKQSPKPLKKLVRVNKAAPANNSGYQGEHEAPQYENPPVVPLRETQDGEYHGRYEAEPVKTKKNPKREWQDVLVKAMSIILSLAVIIILILTLPIVNFKEKDGSSRGVSLIYFIRNYKCIVFFNNFCNF